MAGDSNANAGTSDGGAVNSLRKLVRSRFSGLEDEDSASDMARGVLGLVAVDVVGSTDTGGSGKGHEGGGEIGGNDFLVIHGGGVYKNKSIR